jgi:hypothetical protein
MSNTKFEKLIEYVINDEDAKAKELFHQIVVEKSRSIYESMMEEDNDMGMEPTEIDTDMSEGMGGDKSDDLIDDVEAEEQGVAMEDDEEVEVDMDGDDMGGDDMGGDDMGGEEELEDRVVDLEDKLDELMAEFESMMGGDSMDGDDIAGDDIDMGMSDEEVVDDELETEGMVYENVSLKAAPKPVTAEQGGTNTKSTVAANSGARGMASSPVKMTGDTAQGRPAPTAKDLVGKVGNSPAQGTQQPKPANKPHLAQATGVNTKSPLPRQ